MSYDSRHTTSQKRPYERDERINALRHTAVPWPIDCHGDSNQQQREHTMNDTSLASRRLVAAPSTLQAFPADLSLMSLARAMPHPCSCLLLAPARGCSIAAPRRAPLRLPGAARSCFDHGRRQLSRLHLALPLLFPPAAYCQVPVLLQ